MKAKSDGTREPDDPHESARRLMRQGRDDEAIEALTGLSGLEILEIRAQASVADGDSGALRRSGEPRI